MQFSTNWIEIEEIKQQLGLCCNRKAVQLHCAVTTLSVLCMFVDDLDREGSCLNGESRRPFPVGSINIWTETTFFATRYICKKKVLLKSWIPIKTFEKHMVVILRAHGSGQHLVVSLRDVPI